MTGPGSRSERAQRAKFTPVGCNVCDPPWSMGGLWACPGWGHLVLSGGPVCVKWRGRQAGGLQGLPSVKVGSAGGVMGLSAGVPAEAQSTWSCCCLWYSRPTSTWPRAPSGPPWSASPPASHSSTMPSCLTAVTGGCLVRLGLQEPQTLRLWGHFLSFLLKPSPSSHNGPKRPPVSRLFCS